MNLIDSKLIIKHYLFDTKHIHEINKDKFSLNYPIVYILYDLISNKFYIGETTNAYKRMIDHLSNPDKKELKYVYIISNPVFNKSATLHIEQLLIDHMGSDGSSKKVLNKTNGSSHKYYNENLYIEIFNDIWGNLKLKKVVTKDILDIQNSDLFKFSPYKSLTTDQDQVIIQYLKLLNESTTSRVFIEGSAGTGKTVLAIYLIKLLSTEFDIDDYDSQDSESLEKFYLVKKVIDKHRHLSIGLVIPMVSLRKTLKRVFKSINGLSPNMVLGPSDVVKKEYDLLIVDEAHRLKRRVGITNYRSFDDTNRSLGLKNEGTELDWILLRSKHQIFFYDQAQSIRPSDIPKDRFILMKSEANVFKLSSQLRVKGGIDYIKFVDNLLNPNSNDSRIEFKSKDYDLKLYNNLPEMIRDLEVKESKFGLCRMMAGFAWEWVSRKHEMPDAVIDDVKLYWNRVSQDWINSTTEMNEMGCIHTTQGYDLNYGGVIFGNEIIYNPQTKKIEIIKDNYYDTKGKNGIDNLNVLQDYIINIYKTLMYRGIKGTFIYVCDDNLREYFKNHIRFIL